MKGISQLFLEFACNKIKRCRGGVSYFCISALLIAASETAGPEMDKI
jgi:hypothetical protein